MTWPSLIQSFMRVSDNSSSTQTQRTLTISSLPWNSPSGKVFHFTISTRTLELTVLLLWDFNVVVCCCSVDLSAEEGGRNIELVTNGRSIDVGKHNVHDYVRRYAEYRMVRSQRKALEELRNGVLDVIPSSALEGSSYLLILY